MRTLLKYGLLQLTHPESIFDAEETLFHSIDYVIVTSNGQKCALNRASRIMAVYTK